ncbi:hypothetical protein [Halobellus litoreus]|uniref:Uncharacterized protein n=1 Tax=Halobellus litoreus TaxID=755310 RepID=A0ABD6DX86_9EURY|nr:hypothetical protein [Halobellus litoreus]
MSLRDDDRAVTVQIGAVLLLGFLVVSLSLYQATVVPNENRQVEFQHNQRVQADMQQVRNAILGTAATGSSAPTGVELGTRYPTRVVAVNPGPPSGTLSTADLGTIRIENATADDESTAGPDYPETADFWDGDTTRTYTTKSLVYRPDYANYDAAPTTVYENGVVYNRFDSGTLTRTGQPIVAGKRISLVALSGNLSRGGASTLSMNPRAVSTSTRTISVSNVAEGENVSVFVPSRLNAQSWTDLLNETGEYDPAADPDNDAYVYRVENVENGGQDGVELFFEPDATYQLKLSKVGVGSGVGDTEPAYLTSVDDLESNPFESRTYPFTVELRDKYNNPIGRSVEAGSEETTIPDGVVLEPGRYRYRYTAPDSSAASSDSIGVTFLTESSDPVYDVGNPSFEGERVENVEYDVDIQAAGGGGDGGGGDGTGPLALQAGSGEANANGGESTGIQFVMNNEGSEAVTIESIELSDPSNTASLVYESNGGDGDGQNEVFVDVGDNGANTNDPEDGYYDSGDGNGNNNNWQTGTTGTLDDSAQLSGSESARVYIYRFYQSRSGAGSSTTADMTGESITVRFTYTVNGNEYTESYDVTASA